MASRRTAALLVATCAVALPCLLLLVLQRIPESGRPARAHHPVRGVRPPRFDVEVGEAPEGAGAVWRFRSGSMRVEVEEPTLVQTGSGIVELQPGRYRVVSGAERLEVTVFEGSAVLVEGEERAVAARGATAVLARSRAGPVAPPTTAPPEPPGGPGATLVGTVRDASGRGVEGARIVVVAAGSTGGARTLALTDAAGRFRVEGLAGKVQHVGAEAAGFAPSDLRRIEPPSRAVFEMDFVMRHPGGALATLVRVAMGEPVAGAEVRIGARGYRDLPLRECSPEGYPLFPARERRLTTDAGGWARADGLPPDWNRVRVVATGYAPYESWVHLAPGSTEVVDVALSLGATVFGTVRDAERLPAGGVRVSFLEVRSGNPVVSRMATTRPDGSYRVADLPAGRLEVTALGRVGQQARAWLTLEPGAEVRWDADLCAPGLIEGTVVDPAGIAVEGALVSLRTASASSAALDARLTGPEGDFRFPEVAHRPHELWVWQPGQRYEKRQPPAARVTADPSAGPLRVVLPEGSDERERARLSGTVVDASGAPAAGARLRAWPSGFPNWTETTLAHADGSFTLGSLAPGRIDLEVHLDGHPTLHLTGLDAETGGEILLGVLRLPQAGRIHLRLFDQRGDPVAPVEARVQSFDQRVEYFIRPRDDGTALTEDLAPGRYLVHAGAPGQIAEVEVRPGQTESLQIRALPTGRVRFALTLADGSAPQAARCTLLDDQGRRLFEWMPADGSGVLTVRLAAGRYRLDCGDERNRRASLEFPVVAGAEADVPVTLGR